MSSKQIILIVLAILVAIQFVQPRRNQSFQVPVAGIDKVISIPDRVEAIIKNSCYDCHSNNTRYPWYSGIQPVAWWMATHIEEGKEELNFDEFANYSKRRQLSKLKSIQGAIENKTMPLPSYTFIHQGASVSPADQKLLYNWLEIAKNKISR